MKKIILPLFLFGVILVLTQTSCVKEREFPPQPSIEFKKYVVYKRDSADCIISFKDGDGDIGILSGDTISPDDFVLKYLYKDNVTGVFKPFDVDPATIPIDTLFYSYRVPNITPNGQYKSLEGEIKAKLRTPPLYHPDHKVVKFVITLRDRAGNMSNMVTSNEIVLP